ncbi:hypothetical protein DOTSEDRAFT_70554 [Dothistroma septosporum NZE10]|uniref:Uncharacterized protein n=1 Tax=Dothistroma septosporum (strain NZE10 / CBS 128990) TaxID=675120 RepID=N1PSZ6_DOTSN|nr:hypothetical protein DOTSEDRAFT_70554 [Dothistroma septosporum NZE10]
MPATPSPHRFLATKRQPSPSKNATPSALRHAAHTDSGRIATTGTPRHDLSAPAQSQFAHTPRFGTGKTDRTTHVQQQTPPQPSRAQALRATLGPEEDIEETAEHDERDDEMLDNEQAEALPTTEITFQPAIDQAWSCNLAHSPKRRRLDDQDLGDNFDVATASPARPTFKFPMTPASALAARSQRLTRAGSVASSVGEDKAIIRRPAFLRSSLPGPEQHEPLPEAFSPHRRGEKFVPGGMAATMQQWVIETGQSASHSRKAQGYLRGEDYVLRVIVQSVQGISPLLVEAKQLDGTMTRVFLVVDRKKDSVDVDEGSVVGIRAPTWEVELEERVWTIAVDWKTLPQ